MKSTSLFAMSLLSAGAALLLASLFVLVPAAAARAQSPPPVLNPERPLSQYILDVWQRADGLPQNSVMSIAQTPDGYLWIATQDGLVRFDGMRFTVFNKTTTPELRTSDIQALRVDRHGRLWIGTAGGGLVVIDEGRFASFGAEHGLPNEVISAIYEDSAGVLWVGTSGGGLSRLAGDRFATYTAQNGLAGDVVTGVTEDAEGALWIGTHSGVSRFKDGRFVTYGVKSGLASQDVRAVYTSRDHSIWIATTAGLSRYKDERFTTYTTKDGLSSSFIRTIFEDRAGTLWIGTREGGLTRIVHDRMSRFGSRDGLSDGDVRTFFEDQEGSLWIGTNAGGLNRLKNSKVVTYGTKEGLSHEIALAIAADREGALWVATYGGGVNRFRNGQWSAFFTRHGLASNAVLSLAPAQDGGMWIGTASGLDRLREGRFQHHGPEVGLADEPVLALLEDRQGALWIGTRTGVKRFADGRTKAYTSVDGLGSDVVVAILQRLDGSIWVGTEGGGLSRFEDGRFRTYSRNDGLPNDIVWTISEDKEGTLWLGTNGGGLVRLRHGRFSAYTTREGLFDDVVFRILEDNADNLWMSGSRGIFRVRKSDLDAFDSGQLTQIPAVAYGEADGMRSSETNGGIQPAGWRTADGSLWFPTLKGVVAIQPDRLIRNLRPPPVILEEVLVDRELRDPRAPLVADPGVRSLEFRYAAPSYLAPQRIQFRYILDGFDPDWIDAGGRRVAYYTNIPPGEYRFRVIASNEDDIWNDTGAAISIRLTPHFYQTRLFYALCIAGVALMAFGLHRARVSGLKAREQDLTRLAEERRQALEALKASEEQNRQLQKMEIVGRLAGGVAHDFNNLLTPILGYCDLLLEDLDQRDPHRADVTEIRKAAQSGGSLTRQLLAFSRHQILEPRVLSLNDVARDVEQILRRLIGEHIALKLHTDQRLARVKADPGQIEQVLLNLAVNARDAMPLGGTLTMETSNLTVDDEAALRGGIAAGHYAMLAVSDTGTGMTQDVKSRLFEPFFTTKGHGTGLGLSTVRDIVKQGGGHIAVKSEPGRGATFRIYLPSVEEATPVVPVRIERRLGGDETVLLVEDNDALRELARRILERRGYNMLTAKHGAEAQRVETGHAGPIHLLLTDVVLPGLSGPALAARVRERRSGLKVLYTTGYIDDDIAQYGVLQEGSALLQKPFTTDLLLQKVREVLDETAKTSDVVKSH